MRRAVSDPSLNGPRFVLKTEVVGDDLKRLSAQVKTERDSAQAQVNFSNISQKKRHETMGMLAQYANSTVIQADSMLGILMGRYKN